MQSVDQLTADIVRETPIVRSARVVQASGIFDLPDQTASRVAWHVELPLAERDWNIGLIVGPSGSGKSTVARHFWPELYARQGFEWPEDRSVLDAFPSDLGIKEILELLSSVGFNSPPSWLRPFRVLSVGEQFRVTLARMLAENRELALMDEFTSTVDRTVAQIGSNALAKTVRRRKQRFIAVSCHDDIEEWLQPDWTYRPDVNRFEWRLLQRRPTVGLEIFDVHYSAWAIFKAHHYLSASLHKSARCFTAMYRGRPVAFAAWLPFVGRSRGSIRRCTRIVTLPDYQGVGIGNALLEETAKYWIARGCRATIATSHPGMMASLNRSCRWRMIRAPALASPGGRSSVGGGADRSRALARFTASFEYRADPKPDTRHLAA